MKNHSNKKVISLILSLLIIISFNSGFSHADKNIIYDNPENLIEKISNPSSGEGMADGILPAEGDRSNSYSWALAELGDYVYIGSNRNILTQTLLNMVERQLGAESEDLVLKILKDLSDDAIPTDKNDVADNQGRIFRYNLKEKEFEEIHKSSGIDSGYRSAVNFTPKDESEASVYFGAIGEKSRVIRLGQDFKKEDEPEAVFEGETGDSSVRAMAIHEDSLCIGVLTTDGLLPGQSNGNQGNLEIKQSTNPEKDNWTTIASFEDFAKCNPRTDLMSVGQSGIWDMISFNGSIYAFIGTGYDPNSKENGHSIFKGTHNPDDSESNGAGWVWEMIVGPMEDENGKTGAQYPRGLGNEYDGSASPFLYTNPEGETHVYVGTFDSIFDSLFNIALDKSYKSLYKAMHPAKVYRFDKDDNWEMVIGNPDEYFNAKIGNYYAGFSDDVESSVHSPNFYMWRMAEYKGELFVGTLNPTPLLDVVVPPFTIDLEEYTKEDLMTLIKLFGSVWPEKVVDDFDEAVIEEEAKSEAVLEADKFYLESVEVEEAGKEASDTADSILSLIEKPTEDIDTQNLRVDEEELELETENSAVDDEELEVDAEVLETETEELEIVDDEELILEIKDLIDDLNKKTEKFEDTVLNLDENRKLEKDIDTNIAAASISETDLALATVKASELTAELVKDLENNYQDKEIDLNLDTKLIEKINKTIDAIKAAYEEARNFKDIANNELIDAKEEVEKAIEATCKAKEFFIKVNNELSKLIEDITVDQYKDISKIIDKILELDLGYGKDELENLRYIIELRIMINSNIEADNMGCSVYRSKDGINFTPVTTNGFNDKYNYGLRTFLPTDEGLFMGMANPFYGTQLWRLGDLEESADPVEPTEPGGSGTSSGGSGSRSSRDESEDTSIKKDIITSIELDPTPLGSLKAELERKDRFAYMVGYEDGNIKPLKNTTREEVAMIFYKLLTDESRKSFSSDGNPFKDVDKTKWSNRAISTLYKAGILEGYKDETFRPSDSITRAEFVTMAAKFDKLKESDTNKFSDIKGHWAEKYINHSASKGWVSGYQDGTFKPDQEIIRAEVMELTNNVVGRKISKENIHPDAINWPDNPIDAWYYEAIMEATNNHN